MGGPVGSLGIGGGRSQNLTPLLGDLAEMLASVITCFSGADLSRSIGVIASLPRERGHLFSWPAFSSAG